MEEDSNIFEIEKILDSCVEEGVQYYFVAWKGYGEEENTWEPEENLDGCDEVLEEFRKGCKRQKNIKKSRKRKSGPSATLGNVPKQKKKRRKRQKPKSGAVQPDVWESSLLDNCKNDEDDKTTDKEQDVHQNRKRKETNDNADLNENSYCETKDQVVRKFGHSPRQDAGTLSPSHFQEFPVTEKSPIYASVLNNNNILENPQKRINLGCTENPKAYDTNERSEVLKLCGESLADVDRLVLELDTNISDVYDWDNDAVVGNTAESAMSQGGKNISQPGVPQLPAGNHIEESCSELETDKKDTFKEGESFESLSFADTAKLFDDMDVPEVETDCCQIEIPEEEISKVDSDSCEVEVSKKCLDERKSSDPTCRVEVETESVSHSKNDKNSHEEGRYIDTLSPLNENRTCDDIDFSGAQKHCWQIMEHDIDTEGLSGREILVDDEKDFECTVSGLVESRKNVGEVKIPENLLSYVDRLNLGACGDSGSGGLKNDGSVMTNNVDRIVREGKQNDRWSNEEPEVIGDSDSIDHLEKPHETGLENGLPEKSTKGKDAVAGENSNFVQITQPQASKIFDKLKKVKKVTPIKSVFEEPKCKPEDSSVELCSESLGRRGLSSVDEIDDLSNVSEERGSDVLKDGTNDSAIRVVDDGVCISPSVEQCSSEERDLSVSQKNWRPEHPQEIKIACSSQDMNEKQASLFGMKGGGSSEEKLVKTLKENCLERPSSVFLSDSSTQRFETNGSFSKHVPDKTVKIPKEKSGETSSEILKKVSDWSSRSDSKTDQALPELSTVGRKSFVNDATKERNGGKSFSPKHAPGKAVERPKDTGLSIADQKSLVNDASKKGYERKSSSSNHVSEKSGKTPKEKSGESSLEILKKAADRNARSDTKTGEVVMEFSTVGQNSLVNEPSKERDVRKRSFPMHASGKTVETPKEKSVELFSEVLKKAFDRNARSDKTGQTVSGFSTARQNSSVEFLNSHGDDNAEKFGKQSSAKHKNEKLKSTDSGRDGEKEKTKTFKDSWHSSWKHVRHKEKDRKGHVTAAQKAKSRKKAEDDMKCASKCDVVANIINSSEVYRTKDDKEYEDKTKKFKKRDSDMDISDSDFELDLDDYNPLEIVNEKSFNVCKAYSVQGGIPSAVSLSDVKKAIKKGDSRTVLASLAGGLDIESQDGVTGMTLLIRAVSACQNSIVKLLISHGANVNAKDNTGTTALMMACEQDFVSTASLLLDAEADVNAKQANGETALIKACKKGFDSVVSLLVTYGANCQMRSQSGLTASEWAVRCGHYEVRDILAAHHKKLQRCVEKAITSCLDGFSSLISPPLLPYVCLYPNEGQKFTYHFNCSRRLLDKTVLLYCLRAVFSRSGKVDLSFSKDNGVYTVLLNGSLQTPVLKNNRCVFKLRPKPNTNRLVLQTYQSRVHLLICVYAIDLEGDLVRTEHPDTEIL